MGGRPYQGQCSNSGIAVAAANNFQELGVALYPPVKFTLFLFGILVCVRVCPRHTHAERLPNLQVEAS